MNNSEDRDKRTFFYGAGLDETNNQDMFGQQGMMNNQTMQQPMNDFGMMNQSQSSMNNQDMFGQQGMMNNQTMQQPMNDFNMMNQSQPSMNNQDMFGQQGMMNNQPMQQPMNDFNMMNQSQPGMNNQDMFGQQGMMNNQPMQQPMNDFGMMNQSQPGMNNQGMYNQPMMGQNNMNGAFSNQVNSKKKINLKIIIIGAVAFVVVLLVLILFVFHKTLTCTSDDEFFGVKTESTYKVSFWFGKPVSIKFIYESDFSDIDDDYKDYVDDYKESLIEEYEDEDDYKVKVKGDVVTVTYKSTRDLDDFFDDDDVDYDEIKDSLKELGCKCK